MEGLEISIVNYKEIYLDNEEFRIDSEYYKKEYINIYNKINNGEKLGNLVHMSDVSTNGSFAIVHAILNDSNPPKVPYIRSGNVGNTFLYKEDLTLISEEAHENLPKSTTKLHDVMMARKGKIGGASIITENEVNYNCNENVIKLTILASRFNPFYFTAYFNSKYGIKQIERISTGNVQPWVSIFQIKKLLIPCFCQNFQKNIENTIIQSHFLLNQSQSLYTQAEQLLLEELGLKDWKPSDEQTNIKSFKESFLSTGRLDAEYYQPKYEELIQHLVKYETKLLGRIVDIKKSIEPGSEAYQESGIPFVRVSNISKYGITKTNIHLDRNEYQSYELKPKKDTILLSKDGSVGIAYKVEKDLDIITSGALLHLNVIDNEFLPDYLTLVLNSVVVKLQSERDAGGSIIQHWKPSEIEQVVIPKLPKPIQQQIADNIQESFRLKRQSEQLLEVAKRAVEIAIEQNEDAAIEYINQNTLDL